MYARYFAGFLNGVGLMLLLAMATLSTNNLVKAWGWFLFSIGSLFTLIWWIGQMIENWDKN